MVSEVYASPDLLFYLAVYHMPFLKMIPGSQEQSSWSGVARVQDQEWLGKIVSLQPSVSFPQTQPKGCKYSNNKIPLILKLRNTKLHLNKDEAKEHLLEPSLILKAVSSKPLSNSNQN